MNEQRVIKDFVGSPGDVTEERKRAFEVIESINRDIEIMLPSGVRFEGIGWDQTHYPKLAWLSPQEAINQGIPRPCECDIAVFIFWKRIGTPLLSGTFNENGAGPEPTGTLWEFYDALESPKRPWVMVYRCSKNPEYVANTDGDPMAFANQLQGVERLFAGFKDEAGRYHSDYKKYDNADDFAKRLKEDLQSYIKQQLQPETKSEHTAET